jgi:hypothetical protein
MAQELLETFQAHPGIEKLGGECVAKTMDGVALPFESGLLNVFYEPAPSGTVTDGLIAVAVKDKLLVLIPSPKPEFQGHKNIVAQIDHPPHAVLLALEEMDFSIPDIEIVQPKPQGLADPHARAQEQKDQGPVPDVVNRREKLFHIGGVHGPRKDFRKFELHSPLQNRTGNDLLLHQEMEKSDDARKPRPHRGDP